MAVPWGEYPHRHRDVLLYLGGAWNVESRRFYPVRRHQFLRRIVDLFALPVLCARVCCQRRCAHRFVGFFRRPNPCIPTHGRLFRDVFNQRFVRIFQLETDGKTPSQTSLIPIKTEIKRAFFAALFLFHRTPALMEGQIYRFL